ncbi:MAG: Gfo/Idh/MocA family oxidoreductase [Cytophagales bacterium]|nr:Gfo/Idh/MocA family oxidoreductase [Cytophagales bacterium]
MLGPGIITHEFVQDFAHVTNGIVHSVASRSAERASTFASTYGIPHAYDNYEQLYQDQDIDAIYIATPHTFHFEQSKSAMEAGKAVLCEKPLTEEPDSSKKLIHLAQSQGLYLMEGMWTYFLPAIRTAKSWVEEGRIGAVLHDRSSFGYPVPYAENSRYYSPDLAGGCLLDMGIYNVAMAHLFIGKDIQTIHTQMHHAPTGVDNDVLSQINYGEVSAILHSSFRCKLHNHLYIIGEKGYIDIHDIWRARGCVLYEGERVIDTFDDQRKGNGFEYQIEAVNNDLLAGKTESEVVTHETSLAFQEVIERMREWAI